MSEIEKLYKNARTPKYGKRQCKDSEYLECQNYCFCNIDNRCDKFIIDYPSFTAEKQIELIKWLSKYCMTIDCEDGEYEVYTGFDDNIIENFYDKLEDAIAYCVNKIWQYLTEEEKQQIKEILK